MISITKPHEMSEDCKLKLYLHYSRLPNTGLHSDYVHKRMGLMSTGLSEEEAEALCKPKQMDEKEVMEAVSKLQAQALKDLAWWDRRREEERRWKQRRQSKD